MKRARITLAAMILCSLSLSSCATTHLFRWGFNKTSNYRETDNKEADAFIKPGVTFVGLPFTAAWDVVTLPFQVVWSVYPWGDEYMEPPTRSN